MKKKCYNEECDWEVTYVPLRVCLCVYVAECMRVCAFYLVCVLQNPQTFFFFVSFWFFFQLCHYKISNTKTEKKTQLLHQSHEHHI